MSDEPFDVDDLTVETLEWLVEQNHPETPDLLVEALDHPAREVRIYAALWLAELFQDPRAAFALAEALYTGDQQVRRAAADSLWEIGDTDPRGLLGALRYAYGAEREAIIGALDLIGWVPDDPGVEVAYRIAARDWRGCVLLGAAAVPGLIRALRDPDGAVRRAAAWALGEIGDQRAVPWLIERLNDAEGGLMGVGERVCDIAAEALERIGTAEALAAIEEWWAGQQTDDGQAT